MDGILFKKAEKEDVNAVYSLYKNAIGEKFCVWNEYYPDLQDAAADCEKMWQIGVYILPDYRKSGVASALTANLALEILSLNKVPFYCCARPNVPSARNAIKSGFVPTWVETTVKPSYVVDEFNNVTR